jgi:hypothetical protein
MFWKKEVPLQDVVMSLELFLKIDETVSKMINDISPDPKIQRRMYVEVLILTLFSIDVSLHSVFGNSKEKAAIMNSMLINIIENVPDADPVAFNNLFNKRLIEYAEALKTSHDLGPPYWVGKKFSQFIHNTPELRTAYLGTIVFTGTGTMSLKLIRKIFKEYKIIF